MANTNDIRWLAGWLEGEGSFMISSSQSRGNRVPMPKLSSWTCDKDIADKAAIILRTNVNEKHQGNFKPQFGIQVNGRAAIEWMMTLYSLLGIRRKEKISSIIKEWMKLPAPRNVLGTRNFLPELCSDRQRKYHEKISYYRSQERG